MNILCGYLRTLRQYWQYPKGHFDLLDYGKAIFWITATAALVLCLLFYVGGLIG